VIQERVHALAGSDVRVVDSASATAIELTALLDERGLRTDANGEGSLRLLVTDMPGRFAEVAARFLGRDVEGLPVDQVDLQAS
jgi:glutamate racemase